jgi:hypothetical protein
MIPCMLNFWEERWTFLPVIFFLWIFITRHCRTMVRSVRCHLPEAPNLIIMSEPWVSLIEFVPPGAEACESAYGSGAAPDTRRLRNRRRCRRLLANQLPIGIPTTCEDVKLDLIFFPKERISMCTRISRCVWMWCPKLLRLRTLWFPFLPKFVTFSVELIWIVHFV